VEIASVGTHLFTTRRRFVEKRREVEAFTPLWEHSSRNNVLRHMRTIGIVACAALFVCNMAGVAKAAVPCGQALEAPLRSSATLSISSIAAGIEVVATDQNTVHVSCSADDVESARQTQVQLSETPSGVKLTLTGRHPKHGNITVRIEVPRRTNLGIQLTAGDVKVADVIGDKDFKLRAGAITVSSTHAADYKDVSASVSIGEVSVPADGESKGGYFREFRKQNPSGRYLLHAHVTTGKIVLIGMTTPNAAEAQ
jgi:hypothetical protein